MTRGCVKMGVWVLKESLRRQIRWSGAEGMWLRAKLLLHHRRPRGVGRRVSQCQGLSDFSQCLLSRTPRSPRFSSHGRYQMAPASLMPLRSWKRLSRPIRQAGCFLNTRPHTLSSTVQHQVNKRLMVAASRSSKLGQMVICMPSLRA